MSEVVLVGSGWDSGSGAMPVLPIGGAGGRWCSGVGPVEDTGAPSILGVGDVGLRWRFSGCGSGRDERSTRVVGSRCAVMASTQPQDFVEEQYR